MFTRKTIFRAFSVYLIVMSLLTDVLPVQADSLHSPLSAGGDYLWAKSMGSDPGSYVRSYSIAIDSSGDVYTTGNFVGTADFDPGAGTYNLISTGYGDTFVSKLDSSGNFVWAKRIGGGTIDDNCAGFGIAVDSSSNVYTTGTFHGTVDFDPGTGTFNLTSGDYYDIFVSKLDSNGNFLWAKSMGGEDGHGRGNDIAIDLSGDIYMTGYFGSTTDFDPSAGTFNLTTAGASDIFVSKLDSSGDLLWAKSMGGTGGGGGGIVGEQGISIAVDSSGDVYTTGMYTGTADFDPGAGTADLTSAGDFDIFVSKLAANGDFVWARSMGGLYDNYDPIFMDVDRGNSIAVDSSGDVYTTGTFTGTADFDPGAGTFNLTSPNFGIFVSKLDSSGDFVWAKTMSGGFFGGGYGIALDSGGDVYTTGFFGGTVDFDPGAGTYNLTSVGDAAIFVSKLDGSGDFVWAKHMGGIGVDDVGEGHDIVLDSSGSVYTTGNYYGTVDFDPGAGTANLTSVGGGDIFVSKLEGDGDMTAPTVTSSVRANTNPTPAASVDFTVTFSEFVTGVDTGDFELTTTGVTGASITGLSGSGDTYTVSVNTGSGNGTIRLDVLDDDSIIDGASNPLNGGFTSGETYTVDKATFTNSLSAPVLRAPASNLVTSNTMPSFAWSSVRGAQGYEIEFATDSAFTNNVESEMVNGISYTVLSALSDAAYYWHVRAFNAVDEYGLWSSARILTIDTTGPSAPVLTSPADGASTRTPTFRWTTVPTAVSYQFQYDNDPDFSSPTYSITITGNFRRPPAMAIGTYFWHVRAQDGTGNWSPWSLPRTVDITGP